MQAVAAGVMRTAIFSMRRAFLLPVMLLALVALGRGVAPTAAPPVAHAAVAGADDGPTGDASQVGLVQQAFTAIYGRFFNPVDARDLLNAAWDAAAGAVAAAGAGVTPARPAFADDPVDGFVQFTAAYHQLEDAAAIPPTDLAYTAIRGMTKFIDNCHTYFLTPTQAATQHALLLGGSLVGAGILRTQTRPWLVMYVAPDGPAAQAGLREGDAILAYDGDSSDRAPQTHARPAGGVIVYTIQRQGEPGPRDVAVTMGSFHLPQLESRVLPGGIGYLRFFSWEDGRAQAQAIRDAIAGFEQQGVRAWVLDLRANGGGAWQAIADLFMPSGPILQFGLRGGPGATVYADGNAVQPLRPLAILVGPGSASASEIVPEALREAGDAVLVGEHTEGCMATTAETRLADGSALWITAQHVLVGESGRDFDGIGVTPDIVAPRTAADIAAGRDPGLDAAVQALQHATTDSQLAPADPGGPVPAEAVPLAAGPALAE